MNSPTERGFSRVELMAVIVVLTLLVVWFGSRQVGERARIAHCAGNLKGLGGAMQSYANDNAEGLPAGGMDLGTIKIGWDEELFPYLNLNLANSNGVPAGKGELLVASAPRLLCPSDTLPRGGHPRTYAMGGREVTPGWPPASDDNTGVGVWWDHRTIFALLDNSAWDAALAKPESLPKLKLFVLPAPAATVLLTELSVPDNKVAGLARTRVFLADQQSAASVHAAKSGAKHFNNYLMADGHVELLTTLQSAGVWTIKQGN